MHFSLMYHYVGTRDTLPHFRSVPLGVFENTIHTLKHKGYIICSFAEYLKLREWERKICVMTFDDGLSDHAEVAELLTHYNCTGSFYVLTDCIAGRTVLDTHKAHFIVGLLGGESLGQLSELCDINTMQLEIPRFRSAYIQDDHENDIKSFKRIINYYAPFGILSDYLDNILDKYQLRDLMANIYLNAEDIKKIHEKHEIGSHGMSHRLLSRLNQEEQAKEIVGSSVYLEELLKSKPMGFCYPFGTPESYDATTLKILEVSSYTYATAVAAKSLNANEDVYQLPRYDCNMIDAIIELI